MGYLLHLFFSGGHLSTHCFRYLGHLSIFFSSLFFFFFFSFFFSFFMNNFCIAPFFLSAIKLLRDSNKNLEHLFGGYPIKNIFGVFSQCRSNFFWVNLDGMACCCAYPQCRSSAYLDGVYVILILRAWQTSHKGQQSLTKLNTMQAIYMNGSFPNLNIIYGSSRNSSFVIQELIM